MANVNKTFLTLDGLTSYDGLIKTWANSDNQVAYKSALTSVDGNTLYLYKKANAVLGTDTPDVTISLVAGDAEITVEEASTPTAGYLKTYKIWQGDTSVPANLKGTIDIPKDFVVKSGSIVVNPTGQPAGTYLALVINVTSGTATDETVYINVADLCDVYTAQQNASEVQLAISNSNEISASVVAVDGAKIGYKAESSAGAGDAESVKAALTRLDGSDSTTGSVAKKIKDAIGALDTVNDVAVASYTAGTSGAADVITLAGSVKETNGVIGTGTADTITLSTITTAQINALFS